MIITHHYTLVLDEERDLYIVQNKQAPMCPDCGELLSGYDSRRRHVIGSDGVPYHFLLRRLKCPSCGRLHLEIPDLISPGKHYSANVIRQACIGKGEWCPADDSTIRRWKKKK